MLDESNVRASIRVAKLHRQFTQVSTRFDVSQTITKASILGHPRIVDALITSRALYHVPYHDITKTHTDNMQTVIRKVFKQALGLPFNQSTAILE